MFISLVFQAFSREAGVRSPCHRILFLKYQNLFISNLFISLTLQGFSREERGRSRPCCCRSDLIHLVEYNKLDSMCLQLWWFHSMKESAQGSPHSYAMAHPHLDKCKRHSRGYMYKIPQRKMEPKVWVMCQRRWQVSFRPRNQWRN